MRTTFRILETMIRILFLSANPTDQQKLRVNEEFKEIYFNIHESDHGDKFELVQRHAITGKSLIETLLQVKPTIVHFSGHGSNQGALIFQNQDGKAEEINPTTIAKIFEKFKDTIKCIVLNACYSENQAKSIIGYIDCVIGMSDMISDEAAMSFATTFYQTLGYGKDLKDAFDLGCSQIEIEKLSEETTPKLLVRPGTDAGSIFVDGRISSIITNDQQKNIPFDFDSKLIPILEAAKEKSCTPIIGPSVSTNWVMSNQVIAKKWSERYGFPFKSSDKLLQVAQFLSLENERKTELFPNELLVEEYEKLRIPDFSLDKYKNTIYHVLAGLDLPIYITTNYDLLMETALMNEGKEPVTEFFVWNEDLRKFVNDAGIPSVFPDVFYGSPSKKKTANSYTPTQGKPLVYHICGRYDIKESVVLTEYDFFDFMSYLAKNADREILPLAVRQALKTKPLLYIGYDLGDLDIRQILQILVKSFSSNIRQFNMAIMDKSILKESSDDLEHAVGFMETYAREILNIHTILWEDIEEFSTKLRINWDEYRSNPA